MLFAERRPPARYERDSGDDHQNSSDGNPGPEICSVRQRRQQLRCGSDVGTHGHSCKMEFGSPWSLRAGGPSVCASTYKAARYAYTCIDEKESNDPWPALASELETRGSGCRNYCRRTPTNLKVKKAWRSWRHFRVMHSGDLQGWRILAPIFK